MGKPVLGYWSIRGLAQPIRLLLTYVGTEFEDKKYLVTGEKGKYDNSSWFDVKFTLGLDFPNLPYYIDGQIKITQTNSILRYIGRKHNLCGNTEEERVRVDMAAEQVMDLRNAAVTLFYGGGFDKNKPAYMDKLTGSLKALSDFLADRTWLAGDSLSFPDFHLYEMLDQHLLLDPSCCGPFPNLVSFHQRFQALPRIAAYMKSDRFMERPINNPYA